MLKEELLKSLNWRYAVKRFDPSRKLEPETWQALEAALVLTPSSYGLQPWKFVVVTDQEIKAKLSEHSWNQTQPKDCSHMVVLAARKTMDQAYVDRYLESVEKTRGLEKGAMAGYRKVLVSIVDGMETHLEWNSKQVYIALGQLMTAAAVLGVDTCPMEGIVPEKYDEVLGLTGTNYTSVLGCPVGYRDPEDKTQSAAKVRFDADELVVRI